MVSIGSLQSLKKLVENGTWILVLWASLEVLFRFLSLTIASFPPPAILSQLAAYWEENSKQVSKEYGLGHQTIT